MHLVILALITLAAVHLPTARCKPNVVVVMTDDMAPHYKEMSAKTPNIDAFVAESVEFSRAYVQISVCAPSRMSILHALYPWNEDNGVYNFRDQPKMGFRAARTMPGYFKGRGYKTYGVGKVWHTNGLSGCASKRYEDSKDLWDVSPLSQIDDVSTQYCQLPGIGNEAGGGCVYASDNSIIDTEIITKAVNLITGHNHSFPFFLFVGLRKPHAPFESTEEDMAAYDDTPITLPAEPCFREGEDPGEFPNIEYYANLMISKNIRNSRALGFTTSKCANSGGRYFLWEKTQYTPLGWAEYRAALMATRKLYLASITYLDRQFGRILQALSDTSQEDNTIVVFTSDNGFNLGEHGQWEKKSNYENANRVPLVMRVPGASAAGDTVNGFIELVDLFPTLATLAGIQRDIPSLRLDGKDFSPLFSNSAAATPKAHALYTYPACSLNTYNQRRSDCNKKSSEDYKFISYSVRTIKHRYSLWLNWDCSILKGEGGSVNWADKHTYADILIDHSDKGEVVNLNQHPDYTEARSALVQVLVDEFDIPELNPPDSSGHFPAPNERVSLQMCDTICEQTPSAVSLSFNVPKCKTGCRQGSCYFTSTNWFIKQQSCNYGKKIYGAPLDDLEFTYRWLEVCVSTSSSITTSLCASGPGAEATITEKMCKTVCEQTAEIMSSRFAKGKCEEGCLPGATCTYTGAGRWTSTQSCNYGKSLIGKKAGPLGVRYMSVRICVLLVDGQPKAVRC